jgi:hypothetical protein
VKIQGGKKPTASRGQGFYRRKKAHGKPWARILQAQKTHGKPWARILQAQKTRGKPWAESLGIIL